jgi:hypothetical protein
MVSAWTSDPTNLILVIDRLLSHLALRCTPSRSATYDICDLRAGRSIMTSFSAAFLPRNKAVRRRAFHSDNRRATRLGIESGAQLRNASRSRNRYRPRLREAVRDPFDFVRVAHFAQDDVKDAGINWLPFPMREGVGG